MKIVFLGAAHEVTGSCHYVEACGKRFLIDCGMEQGPDIYENQEIPVNVADIDYIFLTHAHIDHSGLIPLLYSRGFKGEIYTTQATKDLCEIMLRDSAHIQMFEADWRNRKARRKGLPEYTPLYTVEDAAGVMKYFIGVEYDKTISICDGITASFTDIGHLLGSACITFEITEDGEKRTIVFSGDVGNTAQPIIRDPKTIPGCDYLIIESTYGDRSHGSKPDYISELVRILKETFARGGNVIIPSFAVGRTQEMLYFFRQIKEAKLLPEYQNFEVYVDSPLAVSATGVFEKNQYSCFDDETMALIKQGINPLQFPGLQLAVTSDESKAINFNMEPKVILSASGMCDAGRIKHHLKHNLWRSECTILFVGYQAYRTLGRSIVEGAPTVKIFGEEISVNAHIEQLNGISGHADREGLLGWIDAMEKKPKQVFVVHGEDEVTDVFAKTIQNKFKINAIAPYSGDSYDLETLEVLAEGDRKKKEKPSTYKRTSDVFQKLLDAGQRLLAVIKRNENSTNKDLAKFTSQINSLCDKWDVK